MYAQLSYCPDRPEAPWEAVYFSLPGYAQNAQPNLLQARKLAASALARTQSQLSRAEQDALGERIFSIIQWVPDFLGGYSFGTHMAMAHALLPEAEKRAREEAISTLDEAFLARVKLPELQEWRVAVRTMAVLVPDAALNAVYRSSIGCLYMNMRERPDHPSHINRLTGWAVFDSKFREYPDLANSMAACFFTRPFDERQAFANLVRSIDPLELAALDAVLRKDIRQSAGADLLQADFCDALLGAMSAWNTLQSENRTAEARATVAQIELERFVANQSSRCMRIFAATLKAYNEGVTFGPEVDIRNQNAIALYLDSQRRSSRALAPSRQSHLPAPLAETSTAPRGETPDLDPVHAWSIDRLVHWIDGPIAQPKRPLKLDRLCATEQEDWEAEQKKRKQGDAPDDGPLQEQEVQMVVTQGLQSTAQFLLDELNDLISLGTKLQADEALLRACQDCLPGLRALVKQVMAWKASDTDQTVAELQRADRALEALRRGIQQRKGEEQTRQRFTAALFQRLNEEPLLLGKRHGGVIAAPLPLEDWAWAVENFHQRWWSGCLRPSANAAPTPLGPDEALALYVTGSSLSDYAFDISVHLWKRRANSDAPPTTGVGLAPMNQPDWFDTLIPCAVLHVQAKA